MTRTLPIKFLLVALSLGWSGKIIAQGDGNLPLSKAETNKVLNSSFSNLVTSNPNPGNLGTYASLDPINALFVLKATVPINLVKTKKPTEDMSVEQVIEGDEGRWS